MNQTETWVGAKFIRQDGTLIEFPGYQVSDLGRVKSTNYNHSGNERILTGCGKRSRTGMLYYRLILWKGKKKHYVTIHRLVASSFLTSGYFPGALVDHIDSNPENDKLTNLRWVTPKENCNTQHRKDVTPFEKMSAYQNRIKRKVLQVDATTNEVVHEFESIIDASRAMGVAVGSIYSACNRSNKCRGFLWKFK